MTKNKIKKYILMTFTLLVFALMFYGCQKTNINDTLKNITLSYDKNNISVTDFTTKDIKFDNVDTNKFQVNIISYSVIEENKVKIIFTITNKESKQQSETREFIFGNFQPAIDVNEVAKKIKVRYKNTNIVITDFDRNDIIFENYNSEKYTLTLKDIEFKNSTVDITFCLTDKITQKNSQDIKQSITGFLLSNDINTNLNMLTFSYPDIAQTIIEDFNVDKLSHSNYNKDLFSFVIIDHKQDENNIIISYKLQNKNTAESSETKEFRLSGFILKENLIAELNDESNKINVSYPEILTTLISNFNQANVVVSGFDENKFNYKFKNIKILTDKVQLTINLTNNKYTNSLVVSNDKIFELTGFKQESIEELIDLNLSQIVVATVTKPHTLKLSEINEDSFVFSNFDDTKFAVIDKNLEKTTSNAKLSFKLKDKNSSLTSTVKTVTFSKFYDYFEANINNHVRNIGFDLPVNYIHSEITIDKIKPSLIPNENYEFSLNRLTIGLFSFKLEYELKLKDTALVCAGAKTFQSSSRNLPEEMRDGEYNGVQLSKFIYFAKHFNLKSSMFPSDVAENIITPTMDYKGKEVLLKVVYYNDNAKVLTVFATLVQDNQFEEQFSISKLNGISSENTNELSINQNTLSLKFKDEQFLMNNFLRLSLFTSSEAEHQEKLFSLLTFSQKAYLNNNEEVSLVGSSYEFKLTKVEIISNNYAIVRFNYTIKKILKEFNGVKTSNIGERLLANRVGLDQLTYLTSSRILKLLSARLDFNETALTNYPSFYRSRFELSPNNINPFTNFFDKKTDYETLYFNNENSLILEVNKLEANDKDGKIFVEFGIRLEDSLGVILVPPQFTIKKISGFLKVEKELVNRFSLVPGELSQTDENRLNAFKYLIDLYKSEGTTETRHYDFEKLNGNSNITNAQLKFVDNNKKYLHGSDPFQTLKEKKKGHFLFDDNDVVYEALKGVKIDSGENKFFNPTQIIIKPLIASAISVREVDVNYEVKITYQVEISIKNAKGIDDERITEITMYKTILHLLPITLFA